MQEIPGEGKGDCHMVSPFLIEIFYIHLHHGSQNFHSKKVP